MDPVRLDKISYQILSNLMKFYPGKMKFEKEESFMTLYVITIYVYVRHTSAIADRFVPPAIDLTAVCIHVCAV